MNNKKETLEEKMEKLRITIKENSAKQQDLLSGEDKVIVNNPNKKKRNNISRAKKSIINDNQQEMNLDVKQKSGYERFKDTQKRLIESIDKEKKEKEKKELEQESKKNDERKRRLSRRSSFLK